MSRDMVGLVDILKKYKIPVDGLGLAGLVVTNVKINNMVGMVDILKKAG